jgi:hypothetical protein
MPSSGMWRRAGFVTNDVSGDIAASSLADSFYLEDGGDTFLRTVGSHKNYTAPHPRRPLRDTNMS